VNSALAKSDQVLAVSVYLLDGRYNGAGDWPPSPFRLFQALVAAAWTGRAANKAELNALKWLESLPEPPIILAPPAIQAKATTYYVPRNAADVCKGDMEKAAKMRDAKVFKPWIIRDAAMFRYFWKAAGVDSFQDALTQLIDRVYQLGRGIDMAYASIAILDGAQAQYCIDSHAGSVHRPAAVGTVNKAQCPLEDSLDSLTRRHAAQQRRLDNNTLRQAPKPLFKMVSYNSPPTRLLFDILENRPGERFAPQPGCQIVTLVERIRDLLAVRLHSLGPSLLERIVIGRNAGEADKARRIRIIPLPSIGSIHADQQIRRVLVEVPPDCQIESRDIEWALSGLDLSVDPETGEVIDAAGPLFVVTDDRKMLSHYGVVANDQRGWQVWRTVTPAALSVRHPRGKMSGGRRAEHLGAVAHAARQALRHAGFPDGVEVLLVQREPFDTKGSLAAEFAEDSRFQSRQLYHLEVMFSEPVTGPVVVGNGRYLGLGLCAPVQEQGSHPVAQK